MQKSKCHYKERIRSALGCGARRPQWCRRWRFSARSEACFLRASRKRSKICGYGCAGSDGSMGRGSMGRGVGRGATRSMHKCTGQVQHRSTQHCVCSVSYSVPPAGPHLLRREGLHRHDAVAAALGSPDVQLGQAHVQHLRVASQSTQDARHHRPGRTRKALHCST